MRRDPRAARGLRQGCRGHAVAPFGFFTAALGFFGSLAHVHLASLGFAFLAAAAMREISKLKPAALIAVLVLTALSRAQAWRWPKRLSAAKSGRRSRRRSAL